jgi:hypothetical protein
VQLAEASPFARPVSLFHGWAVFAVGETADVPNVCPVGPLERRTILAVTAGGTPPLACPIWVLHGRAVLTVKHSVAPPAPAAVFGNDKAVAGRLILRPIVN